MAGADPRKVGISKNCLEALIEYSEVTSDVQDDVHNCFVHKHERSCKHLEEFGHGLQSEVKEKVWKWCNIQPRRARANRRKK